MQYEDFFALSQLYARYGAVVDAADWDGWVEMFTEDCRYKLQPRENHERGLPLATLAFEGQGMLKDRVYGIRETLFHDPYYQRHVVGAPLVHKVDPDGRICPAGVTGEIAVNRFDIHGFPDPVLFSGYWHNPELTHEHFNRDWFLTGTLAHIDPDGYFWFDGHTTAAHDHPGNPGSTQTST